MRQLDRIMGLFGALSIVALTVILLGALATAEEPRVMYQSSEGAGANARVETDRNVTIVTTGRVASSNDPYVRESALRAQVAANLASSRSLSGSNVVVTSDKGTMVLDGIVAERGDLDRAELIARRTPGVVGVVNQLQVDPNVATRAEALDDADLARRVSERLAVEFERAHLDRRWEYGYGIEAESMELNVAADGGDVMLTGTVPSYDALGRAVTIARSVPGVETVRSDLRIGARDEATMPHDHPGAFAKPQHHPFFGR